MNTKDKRKKRVRAKLSDRPRLSVFRSLNYTYAQIVDQGKVIAYARSQEVENPEKVEGLAGKSLLAYHTGVLVAKKAKEKGISDVVFDRGCYAYHGRVKALAEGARKGGLNF